MIVNLTPCLILLGLFASARLYAASITVTNTNDSGSGSLRQAIADAKSGDTVDALRLRGTMLLSAEIKIDKNLTLYGPGASQFTVNGGQNGRVFHITGGQVNLQGFMITGGKATGSSPNGGGVAIDAHATATLAYCIVSGNSASAGGGIALESDSSSPAGIRLTLNSSTVADNSASSGGGIQNNGGSMALNSSLISRNTATTHGGGISNEGIGSGKAALANCTLTGNSAKQGGGIYDFAAVDLRNCTLTGNSAETGGNIEKDDPPPGDSRIRVVVGNTILANSAGGANCAGAITSQGYNLSSDSTCFDTAATPSDRVSTDPKLGALQIGPDSPPAYPLQPGSPAIDAGNPTCCTDAQGGTLDYDALGQPRVWDGDRDGTARSDIGAVEFLYSTWTVDPQSNGTCTSASPTCKTIQAALDAAPDSSLILIRAGTYSEALTSSKNMIFRGVGRVVLDGSTLSSRILTINAGIFVQLDNLTLSHGHASGLVGSAGAGGAINNAGNLDVTHCTLDHNSARLSGGAIANSGDLFIEESTLSFNSSQGHGGAIQTGSYASIMDCTFVGNSASGSDADRRGGIENENGNGSTAALIDSILANNTGGNCSDTVRSNGHDLSTDGSCGGGLGDLINTDPQLGPLQDNGGDTFTHAFLPTSPAFRAGFPSAFFFTPTDQRGQPRTGLEGMDIGAVQMNWPGDLNRDGKVDSAELQTLLDLLLRKRTPTAAELETYDARPKAVPNGRLYGDSLIGSDDLNWVLRRFLGLETAP